MIEDILRYIFQHFFGHIIIAISVVLAALTFTKYEAKLSQIVTLLENRPLNPNQNFPQLPEQLAGFKMKGEVTEKTPLPPPAPSEIEATFNKLIRHGEREKDEKK